MTDPFDLTERRLLGRALKNLRERAEMTQPEAAERAEVTLTAWQNYEAGKRHWKPGLIRKVTEAIGATLQDLELERERLSGAPASAPRAPSTGLQDRRSPMFHIPVFGRVRAGPQGANVYDVGEPESVIDLANLLGPNARALRLAGESMIPYAEPGGFVIYQLDRWPRRGQGCVIETDDGEYYVKRYERTDGAAVYVTELHPVERELRFEMSKVKGVYAIGLRGD